MHKPITLPIPSLIAILCMASLASGSALPARCQSGSAPLMRAAANDELPLPAWGPYARDHMGPCCLVNRLLNQQFTFPLVISQQRNETLLRSERSADGRLRVRTRQAVVLRRSMGLAPVQALQDDASLPGGSRVANRRTVPTEADAEGLLWRSRTAFTQAGLVQSVVQTPDPTGALIPPQEWGEGDTSVDYFPAFADPAGDGLILRVALTNRSDRTQSYCIDLLGGIDTPSEQFSRNDLTFEADPAQDDATLVVKHPRCPAVFAMATAPLPYTVRRYRVGNDYFGPGGATAFRDDRGGVAPDVASCYAADASPPHGVEAPWALLRIAGIPVPAGKTTVLFLSIGVGADSNAARDGAHILLHIAGDADAPTQSDRVRPPHSTPAPDGTAPVTESAYTRALRAHERVRWAGSSPELSQLMAQTLFNAPMYASRRRGIASRTSNTGRQAGKYNPSDGALIALALTALQPGYAAAELNVHYYTQAPSPPRDAPQALAPINLLALWELGQETHSKDLLAHFYPAARRDYLAMREAVGADREGGPLTWPNPLHDPIFVPPPGLPNQTSSGPAAYIACAARLLRDIALLTQQADTEVDGYSKDITRAVTALNGTLSATGTGDAKNASRAAMPGGSGTLDTLLPLIAGADALRPERRAALLASLTDPMQYWSPAGLRQRSRAAPGYQADDPNQGGIRFGMNWLLWKGLLDLGETSLAHRLANALLASYRSAVQSDGGCPEWLSGDTGMPCGARDVSGDACALIPMFAAYHLAGTVTPGWSVALLDRRYNATADSLHFAWRNLDRQHTGVLLCALAHPHGVYTLSGSLHGTRTADEEGVLELTLPRDSTTQSVDIVPANGTP